MINIGKILYAILRLHWQVHNRSIFPQYSYTILDQYRLQYSILFAILEQHCTANMFFSNIATIFTLTLDQHWLVHIRSIFRQYSYTILDQYCFNIGATLQSQYVSSNIPTIFTQTLDQYSLVHNYAIFPQYSHTISE